MNQTERASILSSDSNELLRRQLQNVFRILAKPDDRRREQALQVRQDVSSKWRIQAAQAIWFPWPTTVAPPSARKLKRVYWWPRGMLGFLGYHVGQTQPTPRSVRQCTLEYAFECSLPPLNGLGYYLGWGEPCTAQRLKKLADTLAALTRNAKRHDETCYAAAIEDWEDDLVFLHTRYYVDFFDFGWPASDTLH
jgi:hypothetical protein